MQVNLTGMFNGCKRAVQQMITQEPQNEVQRTPDQPGIAARHRFRTAATRPTE